MPEDATKSPFPIIDPVVPVPTPVPVNQTETETNIKTIETDTGNRRSVAGDLFGMSGRFWVTLLSILGATYVVALIMKSDLQNETKSAVGIAYITLAASVANTYMGQNKSKQI